MSKTIEMLPCPFCGGEPIFLPYFSKHRGKRVEGLTIKCSSCVIRKDQLTMRYGLDWLRESMISDWNTRTTNHLITSIPAAL